MKLNAAATSPLTEDSVQPYREGLQELTDTIARRKRTLYHIALNRLNNSADAEDALQDAFLSAYAHLHQFKRESQMSTWLTAIVINSARLTARRRGRAVHLSLEGSDLADESYSLQEVLPDRRPTPEEMCLASELGARIAQLSKSLAPQLREAYILRDVNGLTTRETAQVLGVREGAVKARLVRARGKLLTLGRKDLRGKHTAIRPLRYESQ